METEAVEAAGSYPGKIVQDPVVAAPKDSAGNLSFVVAVVVVVAAAAAAAAGGLVAEYNLVMPVIRMDCRNSKDMVVALAFLRKTVAAAAEPVLVRPERQTG